MRLLEYLLECALAPDERSARGLIMRGDVLVDERPQTSPSFTLPPGCQVRVRGEVQSATRGFRKIAPVMERLGFSAEGQVCIDLGASTGGFTRALLEAGAKRVYAVDVAYGIIEMELRNDDRVVLLERCNARSLTVDQIPEKIQRGTGDLSFISWRAVLPAISPLLEEAAELLLLVKPQFELSAMGRSLELSEGIVLDPRLWREALLSLLPEWNAQGLETLALVPAALRGAGGNQEFFAHLRMSRKGVSLAAYETMLDQAIEECSA